MARLTTRINIVGMCRTKKLWTGSVWAGPHLGVAGEALDGVTPSTWKEKGSDTVEPSLLIDEGESEKNIPLYSFNILQAAEANPHATVQLIIDEAPDVAMKFDLDPDDEDFYRTLAEALVYLSCDEVKDDDYAYRYWYFPWKKAKEKNPTILGEGREVKHPGKNAEPEDEDDPEPEAVSAAEADW